MFQPDTRRVIVVSEKMVEEDHSIIHRLKDEGYLPLSAELSAKIESQIGLDRPAIIKERSSLLQEIRAALDANPATSRKPHRGGKK